MIEVDLNKLAENIENLRNNSDFQKETLLGIHYQGVLNQKVINILKELKNIIIGSNIEDKVRCNLDEEYESWNDIIFEGSKEWSISIGDKSSLLNPLPNAHEDIKEFIFFDKNYFLNEWIEESSGIRNPFEIGDLTKNNQNKIYVYGIDDFLGGPRIAILPLNRRFDDLSAYDWLKSTNLPSSDKIMKAVHVISPNVVTNFTPENFLITWGNLDCDLALRFHQASAQALLYTLVQEYYSNNKILLHGKKRIEVKMCKENDIDLEHIDNITKKNIDDLRKIVNWCYSSQDETTRILLIIDRLTLDIDTDKTLLQVIPEKICKAFKEAQSRYNYIIKDRKAEYAKELSDLQKDIVSVVDKYVTGTNNYILGFLKDILTFAFILTVGVLAKKLVHESLLFSDEAGVFFKGFAIYLCFSFILRLWHFIVVVKQAEKLTISWKDIVRNHMSTSELRNYITDALKGVKLNFKIIVSFLSLMYILMAFASWNSSKTLNYIFQKDVSVIAKEQK